MKIKIPQWICQFTKCCTIIRIFFSFIKLHLAHNAKLRLYATHRFALFGSARCLYYFSRPLGRIHFSEYTEPSNIRALNRANNEIEQEWESKQTVNGSGIERVREDRSGCKRVGIKPKSKCMFYVFVVLLYFFWLFVLNRIKKTVSFMAKWSFCSPASPHESQNIMPKMANILLRTRYTLLLCVTE